MHHLSSYELSLMSISFLTLASKNAPASTMRNYKTTEIQDRPNLLLVDDKPENLLALESILDDLECSLFKALSGQDALRLVLKHDFALALVDVQMPEMNGFELAELIRGRQETRHLPFIFVTAISQEPRYVFKGYEVGAVDYLFKPIKPEILRSVKYGPR